MLGAGAQKLGTSPYGIGTPTDNDPNGGVPFFDQRTGLSARARAIDVHTRDYVIGPFGRNVGMNSVQQMVYLAVKTVYGSAAWRVLGQKLRGGRISDSFAATVEAELRRCVSHLTTPKIVRVERVDVTRTDVPGRAYATLLWRDLTPGSSAQVQTEQLFR